MENHCLVRLTSTEVKEFQRLYEQAQELTDRVILPKIHGIWKDVPKDISFNRANRAHHTSFEGLEINNKGEAEVVCKGTETWSYGGYEDHYFSFPIMYLYNTAFDKIEEAERDQLLAEIEEKARIAREQAKKTRIKKAQEKEANELAEYKRLRKKFAI